MYCIWVELPVQRRLCPIFREKCRVTRHSRVFCGLTGSQRTPGVWGVTLSNNLGLTFFISIFHMEKFLFSLRVFYYAHDKMLIEILPISLLVV